MRTTNLITLRLLAGFLFLGGILTPDPTWRLGLLLTAALLACTTVVIEEIRAAKRKLLEKLLERTKPL